MATETHCLYKNAQEVLPPSPNSTSPSPPLFDGTTRCGERGKEMAQGSRPMLDGDGPHSYAQNSTYQKSAVDAIKALLSEGIKNKFDIKNSCFDTSITIRIADLGCSTGPNTFFSVENIMEAIQLKHQTQSLEFQVFFNDLTDNDFNTLFKTLPSYQKYFAAGVPGSFYNCLFPKSSIHFVNSSYALHWLSRVPKEIVESPTLNKESIYCSGLVKEVVKAYSYQFNNDMERFLNARAEEIVNEGLMALQFSGLLNEDQRPWVSMDVLGDALRDMAKLGVIREEKVDSFNLPLYETTLKELEEIVKRNGHFRIERLEALNHPMMSSHIKGDTDFLVSMIRAISGKILEEHFEIEANISDKIFQHFAKKIKDNPSASDEFDYSTILFMLLKRTIN